MTIKQKHITSLLLRNLILWCGMFLFSHSTNAQNYVIYQYSSENGLPNTFIKSIAKDSLGFIWISTDNGLVRFNGVMFQQFTNDLPSPYVKCVSLLKNGELYALTDMGLVQIEYNYDTAYFKTVVAGTNSESDTTINYGKQLFEDKKGRLWIAENRAMSYYYNKRFKRFKFQNKDESESFYRSFSMIEFDNAQLIVFSERGNPYFFDDNTEHFFPIRLDTKLPSVSHAVAVNDKRVLLATFKGIYDLSFADHTYIKKAEIVVPNLNASCVAIEEEGKYLIGTWDAGMHRVREYKGKFLTEKIDEFKSNNATYIFKDKTGQFWFTADNGVFLMQQTPFEPHIKGIPPLFVQSVHQLNNNKVVAISGTKLYSLAFDGKIHNVGMIGEHVGIGSILYAVPFQRAYAYTTTTIQLNISDFRGPRKFFDLSHLGSYVFYITTDLKGNLWMSQNALQGILRVTPQQKVIPYTAKKGVTNYTYLSKIDKQGNLYLFGQNDTSYLFKYDEKNDNFINLSPPLKFTYEGELHINDAIINDQVIYMGTSIGLLKYEKDSVSRIDVGPYTNMNIRALALDRQGDIWIGNDGGLIRLSKGNVVMFKVKNGLGSNISYRSVVADSANYIWVGTSSGVSFSTNKIMPEKTPIPYISPITVNGSKNFNPRRIISGSYMNVAFYSLAYPGNEIVYQVRVLEENPQWSAETSRNDFQIPRLNTGEYTLQVRARQDGNYLWSEPASFRFKVLPAWYSTWWAIVIYIVLGIFVMWVIVKLYTARLVRQKQRLEDIVAIRTADLQEANSQILLQKKEIEEAHKQTQESITYAARIQNALLPPTEWLDSELGDYFVFWRPRNIVSGDFYWAKKIRHYLVLAVADCTGHGVPGGFMSMLGIAFLNEIIRRQDVTQSDQVLNILRENIKSALQQTGKRGERQDGMDIGFCIINTQTRELQYAGAHHSLFLIRAKTQPEFAKMENTKSMENEQYKLLQVHGDEQPAGIFRLEKPFSNKTIQLLPNDMFYLCSDGYADQTGGNKGHKFMIKHFKELLLNIAHLSATEQKNMIAQNIDQWMKNHPQQVDDMLVLGLRI